MMRIGIISDTHGRVPRQLGELLADCDAVIHAGDIGGQRVLDKIREMLPDRPVRAVLGNNDDAGDYSTPIYPDEVLVFDGVAFLVSHTPADARQLASDFQFKEIYDAVGDIVVVHGHTHLPRTEQRSEREAVVCPGALAEPRGDAGRSVAKVDVEAGRVIRTEIVALGGEVLESI